jgi:RNA polymerase sigma-70 factor (ECF subfamily)
MNERQEALLFCFSFIAHRSSFIVPREGPPVSADKDFDTRLSRISTLWTDVFEAHGGQGAESAAAQKRLLQRYCGAIYRYLRAALRDPDAADELAQEFALRFVRGDFKKADPGKGRFRDYVKTALFHLVATYHRHKGRDPRALPGDNYEPPDRSPPHDEVADKEFLDRWREALLARCWEALARLERETGQLYHTALHFRSSNPEVSSAEMAEQLGAKLGCPLTAAGIRQTIHRARAKFADLLIAEVAASLGADETEAIEQELADLGLLPFCQDALARRKGQDKKQP